MPQARDLDWDDLRYLLAVARAGGLAGAARSLGVNHSTVFRRLNALEAGLGVRLFERRPGGYQPTQPGGDLVTAAERVEAEVQALDRRLAGQDARLAGSLRITAPDDIAQRLLMAPIAGFLAAYPEIRLEVVIDNRMLSLTRREADVAVRPTLKPPEALVGRRVGQLASAIYGAANTAPVMSCKTIEDLGAQPWIAWDEGVGPAALGRWMAQRAPRAPIVYRSNSLLNQLAACRAGLGLAVLPSFLGDLEVGLARIMPPQEELVSDLWLLTHPDLRRSARVRVFLDYLFGALKAARPLLGGAGGKAGSV
jgi:DNA-binding transcriptional LysR family regulator